MEKKLAGKVVIVTGASSGIGEATAWQLGRDGAKLVLAARRADRLNQTAQAMQNEGIAVTAIATDVTCAAEVESLVKKTLQTYGRVDILLNNAGVMPLSLMKNTKIKEWENMIDVNLKGALYAISAVLPSMREQKSGHIVNISSVAGRKVFPGGGVYCATKFALNAVSEALRAELASDNIKVTVIEPGFVATELTGTITDKEVLARFGELGKIRALDAKDIANAVAYAVTQPAHVNVNELMVTPTEQTM